MTVLPRLRPVEARPADRGRSVRLHDPLGIAGASGEAPGDVFGWIGRDLRTGAVLGISVFVFFGALATYQFIKIRDWAWLPAVAGGVYAVLPDLMLGPADDVGAILLGAALSGLLAWRRGKTAQPTAFDDE